MAKYQNVLCFIIMTALRYEHCVLPLAASWDGSQVFFYLIFVIHYSLILASVRR